MPVLEKTQLSPVGGSSTKRLSPKQQLTNILYAADQIPFAPSAVRNYKRAVITLHKHDSAPEWFQLELDELPTHAPHISVPKEILHAISKVQGAAADAGESVQIGLDIFYEDPLVFAELRGCRVYFASFDEVKELLHILAKPQ